MSVHAGGAKPRGRPAGMCAVQRRVRHAPGDEAEVDHVGYGRIHQLVSHQFKRHLEIRWHPHRCLALQPVEPPVPERALEANGIYPHCAVPQTVELEAVEQPELLARLHRCGARRPRCYTIAGPDLGVARRWARRWACRRHPRVVHGWAGRRGGAYPGVMPVRSRGRRGARRLLAPGR